MRVTQNILTFDCRCIKDKDFSYDLVLFRQTSLRRMFTWLVLQVQYLIAGCMQICGIGSFDWGLLSIYTAYCLGSCIFDKETSTEENCDKKQGHQKGTKRLNDGSPKQNGRENVQTSSAMVPIANGNTSDAARLLQIDIIRLAPVFRTVEFEYLSCLKDKTKLVPKAEAYRKFHYCAKKVGSLLAKVIPSDDAESENVALNATIVFLKQRLSNLQAE